MAKSGFWLRGSKGKLAGTVLYQSQGSTIQREIVTPKNPQSDNQMRQRAAFAGASKFYQNAQQNRFVLAFQNKKGNQSEFNAFMQKNLREFDTLTYPTREQANTPEFCNYFPWICTEGNLQGIPVNFNNSSTAFTGIKYYDDASGTNSLTWDDLIALNPSLNLQYGDIITLTVVLNDEVYNDTTLDVVVGNITPRWITRQFIIGADLEGYTLQQYLASNGFLADVIGPGSDDEYIGINLNAICEELGLTDDEFEADTIAAMICVTRSRNEGSKLKVSTSRFVLDDMAQRIFERLSNDTAMRDAIESYKKGSNSNIEPANILQGSVAENIPVSDLYYRNSSGDTAHTSAPATGVSAEAVVSEGNATAVLEIYGIASKEVVKAANVSATASGWSFVIESTSKRIQGSHTMTKWEGAKITFKKTDATSGSTPFSIKYNDVEVAGGNIVVGA